MLGIFYNILEVYLLNSRSRTHLVLAQFRFFTSCDIDLNIREYLIHRLILKLNHGFNGKPGFWRIWSAIYCFKRSRGSDSPLWQRCHQGISQNFDIEIGINQKSVQTANPIDFKCEVISKDILNWVPSSENSNQIIVPKLFNLV